MKTGMSIAALAATGLLAGGVAFAASPQADHGATSTPPGHAAVAKDFSKLSADGVRAYQDLTLARLAIFDGRTNDAKRYVADADNGFTKAKSDQSVFTQAEANMRAHKMQGNPHQAMGAGADGASGSGSGANASASEGSGVAASNASGSANDDVNKPVAWLPVDGTVSINEDFSLKPAKAKAVEEANKSLSKGDRKGAMDKLKLADVDTTVTLAVVPLQQTIADVDQAKQLIDSGKFYEGSQKLRAVQDATLFTVAAVPNAVPAEPGSTQTQPQAAPATH